MAIDLDELDDLDDPYLVFWRERHLVTLTTLRPDGTPHVVPVGATFDPRTRTVRIITSAHSKKARNVAAYADEGGPASVCQVDGRRWATLEGTAVLRTDPQQVAEAERRYAERYRTPRENPDRVVIEIQVARALGRG